MFARGILSFIFIMMAASASLHAATINIEGEPAELTKLRQAYEMEKRAALQPIVSRYQQDLQTVEKLQTNREELKRALISDYESQKKNATQIVDAKYVQNLDALEKNLIDRKDLKGALVVQMEKKKILSESGASSSTTSTSAPVASIKPVAATPRPGPFVYSSETEGRAGAPGFSLNNIYKLNVNEVRGNTKLTVYASGRGSKDSYGTISIITPAGQEIAIHKWEPDDFSDAANEVSSYKKLKPIEEMVSQFITRPGIYQIRFDYRKGIEPLIIKYVELKTW